MNTTYHEDEREDIALPVHFGLLYIVEGCNASLRFRCHGASRLDVTIIHEPLTASVKSYDFLGDSESVTIHVTDGDSLTILVRASGKIEACAVLQVDVGLAERIRNVVRQCILRDLEIDPCDASLVQRGCETALVNACGIEACEVGQ